ncbi:class I SAM-dependent methyltransferase [Catenulispora sp. NF23]|uniref:Class I SAM-dependent methyltransferase n=1 Tax=Catenulispora pinistramenti TaxID=2705254 RepID=A0ABS5KRQ5_9ACTN|nr:class I SAM-dependent methyltransferase [Catenulispora pinistramenti]MBS2533554.1 class I SAM-dependent methyltransferase [Catenulispora pinistramenti]MBS2548694.1 class I SAM-dependent methyltransferase [Catenulispora pinistramenti]
MIAADRASPGVREDQMERLPRSIPVVPWQGDRSGPVGLDAVGQSSGRGVHQVRGSDLASLRQCEVRPIGVADLQADIEGVEAMREHYVRTVRLWLATLEARWPQAVELVGVETARVWLLYLAGAALAFEQGRMGVDQILAVRSAGMER